MELREVKRKAKAGDFIRVCNNAVYLVGCKPGDIVYIDGELQKPLGDGFIQGCGASYDLDEYVVLKKVKTNKVKEVKRAAKPGEYIKLTKARFGFNEVGDVLKVNTTQETRVSVSPADHLRGGVISSIFGYGGDWEYPHSDYVVLEGYTSRGKPEAKPETTPETKKYKIVITEGDKVLHSLESDAILALVDSEREIISLSCMSCDPKTKAFMLRGLSSLTEDVINSILSEGAK